MPAAAFFDLDRTLLAGSSAAVFGRHLAAVGLGPGHELPGAGLYQRSYEMFGESRLMMRLARVFVRSAKGWPVADVAQAAKSAVDDLDSQVQPFARSLLEEHRRAGRLLVLATTSPEVLVAPFAQRLGFDHVLATEWADDGIEFSGELRGEFLWGRAKRDAVRGFAARSGVSLPRSYAYSDSAYDVAMLKAVGHPVAVNPDPRLAVIAAVNGWPVRHLDVAPGVAKLAGRELQEWLRPLMHPRLVPNARFEFSGIEHIPASGPAIVAFNHRSYFDPTAMALLLARAGRAARFLGKKEVFDVPLAGRLGVMLGGIRVDRGSGDDEPLGKAVEALAGGDLVAMAPQGTIPRGPAFFDPVLKARWGTARLARASGAPVVPVGLWGTEAVWPRSSRLPSLDISDPPLVTVRAGAPFVLDDTYSRDDCEVAAEQPGDGDSEEAADGASGQPGDCSSEAQLAADSERIMAAIAGLLPPQARRHRRPSAAELARTYPPGYAGDPESEADRRPGTDTESHR